MIDFHCHLDLYPNALHLLHEVSSKNIFTLAVTTSPRAWQQTSRLFKGFDNIKVAIGMHPEIVDKKYQELELLKTSLQHTSFVGEVGIDGSTRFLKSVALQEAVFSEIIAECEKNNGRIISIHSRSAAKRVLDILEKGNYSSTPVLHWFSGTIKDVQRAKELGCWFSVGPAMLNSDKGVSLLHEMPIERVLPETDGPLASLGRLPLMPWEAITISDTLSNIYHLPKDSLQKQLKANLNELLRKG